MPSRLNNRMMATRMASMCVAIILLRSERGTGVGESVHANAEPGHAVAAPDAEQTKQQDDGDAHGFHVRRHHPVEIGTRYWSWRKCSRECRTRPRRSCPRCRPD